MTSEGGRDDRPWWQGTAGRRTLVLSLLLLFGYGFFVQVPAWNEYSRYDLTRALVEEGTTRIDSFHENTGDKAFYDGHYFSDKAPGTALIGVPVYALLSGATRAAGLGTPDPVDAVAVLSLAVSGVSTVVLVLLLVGLLAPIVGDGWALVVGIGYGFGSIAFPFATMFFGHAASAALLLGAFYLLRHPRRPGGRWGPVAAGFLAGWAVVTEIPVVLGVAVLGVYALSLGRGVAVRFVAGGLLPALVLLGYNWLTFDHPLSLGYQYATLFSEQNQQGIVSIVWPSPTKAADLLLSQRGLLRLAPWLALAPLGLLAVRVRAIRAEVLVAAAICVAFLLYNSGAINPFGGWTPGPRYLLPALPFAAILVAVAPLAVPARSAPGIRVVTAGLVVLSVVLVCIATVTMPNAPERYADPLVELWLPRLGGEWLADTVAWRRWGLAGIAPLGVLVAGAALGIAGLAASFRPGAAAARATAASIAGLAVLVVAFSVPFPSPGPVILPVGASAGDAPAFAIARLGVTPIATSTTRDVAVTAQIESTGTAVADTRVEFAVISPGGDRTWSAWFADTSWDTGERRTLTVHWDPTGMPRGDYRFEARVFSETDETQYATAVGREPLRVGR